MDDFIDPDVADRARLDFPDPDSSDWIQYKHINEQKLGCSNRDLLRDIHLQIIDEFNSSRFLELLSILTGIPELMADETMDGVVVFIRSSAADISTFTPILQPTLTIRPGPGASTCCYT